MTQGLFDDLLLEEDKQPQQQTQSSGGLFDDLLLDEDKPVAQQPIQPVQPMVQQPAQQPVQPMTQPTTNGYLTNKQIHPILSNFVPKSKPVASVPQQNVDGKEKDALTKAAEFLDKLNYNFGNYSDLEKQGAMTATQLPDGSYTINGNAKFDQTRPTPFRDLGVEIGRRLAPQGLEERMYGTREQRALLKGDTPTTPFELKEGLDNGFITKDEYVKGINKFYDYERAKADAEVREARGRRNAEIATDVLVNAALMFASPGAMLAKGVGKAGSKALGALAKNSAKGTSILGKELTQEQLSRIGQTLGNSRMAQISKNPLYQGLELAGQGAVDMGAYGGITNEVAKAMNDPYANPNTLEAVKHSAGAGAIMGPVLGGAINGIGRAANSQLVAEILNNSPKLAKIAGALEYFLNYDFTKSKQANNYATLQRKLSKVLSGGSKDLTQEDLLNIAEASNLTPEEAIAFYDYLHHGDRSAFVKEQMEKELQEDDELFNQIVNPKENVAIEPQEQEQIIPEVQTNVQPQKVQNEPSIPAINEQKTIQQEVNGGSTKVIKDNPSERQVEPPTSDREITKEEFEALKNQGKFQNKPQDVVDEEELINSLLGVDKPVEVKPVENKVVPKQEPQADNVPVEQSTTEKVLKPQTEEPKVEEAPKEEFKFGEGYKTAEEGEVYQTVEAAKARVKELSTAKQKAWDAVDKKIDEIKDLEIKKNPKKINLKINHELEIKEKELEDLYEKANKATKKYEDNEKIINSTEAKDLKRFESTNKDILRRDLNDIVGTQTQDIQGQNIASAKDLYKYNEEAETPDMSRVVNDKPSIKYDPDSYDENLIDFIKSHYEYYEAQDGKLHLIYKTGPKKGEFVPEKEVQAIKDKLQRDKTFKENKKLEAEAGRFNERQNYSQTHANDENIYNDGVIIEGQSRTLDDAKLKAFVKKVFNISDTNTKVKTYKEAMKDMSEYERQEFVEDVYNAIEQLTRMKKGVLGHDMTNDAALNVYKRELEALTEAEKQVRTGKSKSIEEPTKEFGEPSEADLKEGKTKNNYNNEDFVEEESTEINEEFNSNIFEEWATENQLENFKIMVKLKGKSQKADTKIREIYTDLLDGNAKSLDSFSPEDRFKKIYEQAVKKGYSENRLQEIYDALRESMINFKGRNLEISRHAAIEKLNEATKYFCDKNGVNIKTEGYDGFVNGLKKVADKIEDLSNSKLYGEAVALYQENKGSFNFVKNEYINNKLDKMFSDLTGVRKAQIKSHIKKGNLGGIIDVFNSAKGYIKNTLTGREKLIYSKPDTTKTGVKDYSNTHATDIWDREVGDITQDLEWKKYSKEVKGAFNKLSVSKLNTLFKSKSFFLETADHINMMFGLSNNEFRRKLIKSLSDNQISCEVKLVKGGNSYGDGVIEINEKLQGYERLEVVKHEYLHFLQDYYSTEIPELRGIFENSIKVNEKINELREAHPRFYKDAERVAEEKLWTKSNGATVNYTGENELSEIQKILDNASKNKLEYIDEFKKEYKNYKFDTCEREARDFARGAELDTFLGEKINEPKSRLRANEKGHRSVSGTSRGEKGSNSSENAEGIRLLQSTEQPNSRGEGLHSGNAGPRQTRRRRLNSLIPYNKKVGIDVPAKEKLDVSRGISAAKKIAKFSLDREKDMTTNWGILSKERAEGLITKRNGANRGFYFKQGPDPSLNFDKILYGKDYNSRAKGVLGKSKGGLQINSTPEEIHYLMAVDKAYRQSVDDIVDFVDKEFGKPLTPHYHDNKVSKTIEKILSADDGYVAVSYPELYAGLYLKKSKKWLDVVNKGEEEVRKAFGDQLGKSELKDVLDFAHRIKQKDFQIPKDVYNSLLDGNRETLREMYESYIKPNGGNFVNLLPKALPVMLDFYNSQFKKGVLTSASFFVNNRLGNQAMLFASADNGVDYLKSFAEAFKTKTDKMPVDLVDNSILNAIEDFNVRKHYTGYTGIDNILNLCNGHLIDMKQLNNGLTKTGVGLMNGAIGIPNRAFTKISNKVMEINKTFENFERKQAASIQLSNIKRQKLQATAQQMAVTQNLSEVLESNPELTGVISERVQDILGNYANFTPFEKNILRRVIPFYSWYRTISKNSLHLYQKDPTKFISLVMSLSYMKSRDIDMKEYQRGSARTGITDKRSGKELIVNKGDYYDPWTTVRDFAGTSEGAGPVGSVLGSTTPAIKTPIEALMGHKFFLGQEFSGEDLYGVKSGSKVHYYNNKTGKEYTRLPLNERAKYIGKDLGLKTVYPGLRSSLLNIEGHSVAAGKVLDDFVKTGKVKRYELPDKLYDTSWGGFRDGDVVSRKETVTINGKPMEVEIPLIVEGKKNEKGSLKLQVAKRYAASNSSTRVKLLNQLLGTSIQVKNPLNNKEMKKFLDTLIKVQGD